MSLTPAGLPLVNLVGNSCETSKPVSVTMTGALNLVVPGPGNTFSAAATAKKG